MTSEPVPRAPVTARSLHSLARARLVVPMLVQVACVGEPRVATTIVLWDSAGVTMFEAPVDSLTVETWSVGTTPDLLIDDHQTREPLYRVRAGGLFGDGGIVIANEGSHEVRFYSRTGALERRVGRQGSGPNEFTSMDLLTVVGDTVWVYDRRNQRASVLTRSGEFIRLIPLGAMSDKGLAFAVGVFGDGSILLARADPGFGEAGLRRSYRRLFVRHADGSSTEVGRFFRGESYWTPVEGGMVDVGRPFAREGLTSVRGREWFHSAGDEYRVEQYDIGGRLRRVYSHATKPRAVTQGDLNEYLKEIRAAVGRSGAREQLLRSAPLPERMPAYAGLLIDQEGNVWAAPHAGARRLNCWHVYQPRPPGFARACLPDQFTVLDIARGSVLGVLRDENDLERVARYRLVK